MTAYDPKARPFFSKPGDAYDIRMTAHERARQHDIDVADKIRDRLAYDQTCERSGTEANRLRGHLRVTFEDKWGHDPRVLMLRQARRRVDHRRACGGGQ